VSPLLSPVASGDGHEYMKSKLEDEVIGSLTHFRDWQTSTTELRCNWLDGTSPLDWPEYPLDTPSKVLVSGTGMRRVTSWGLFSTNFVEHPQGLELKDVDLQAGIRRQYHSSGNLSMLWSEQQEKLDVLNSLDRISDLMSEEDSPSVSTVEECATPGKRGSSKHGANYVRIVSKQMVGIYVSVWVSRKLRRHVNNLEVSPVGVGLLGYMGNKVILSPTGCAFIASVDVESQMKMLILVRYLIFPCAGIHFHQHVSFPDSIVLCLLPSCIWS
jgi:hypothetical protein